MKKAFLSLLLLIQVIYSFSQDKSQYEKHWFVQYGDTLPYRILLPENYNPSTKYPLIIFLHGRGESGNDNEKQLTHGAGLFLRDSVRKKYPAIVVFPQCSKESYWSNVQAVMQGSKASRRTFYFIPDGEPTDAMRLAIGLLHNLFLRYAIKQEQVYVMGLSMGGMGTFEMVRRKPETFAAAVSICGGAHTETAKQMRKARWWIFHGAKDDIVPPEFSIKMAEALKRKGASVKLTIYPEANHNSWDPAFNEKDLIPWLFSNKK